MAVKAALGKATWLGHPDPKARLALHVDASSSHIGAALHQQLQGHSSWQRRMIAARFIWPGMKTDIASWCRDCVPCQRVKVTKQPRASV